MKDLRPIVAMAELYRPGQVYAPRAPAGSDWLPDDPALLDLLTGTELCVAGAMPVVCSAGVVSRGGLDLLAEAGLEPTPNRHPYRDGEAVKVAHDLMQDGSRKLIVQHAHPRAMLPAEVQWIDPTLLSYLNNKANAQELASAEHVPPRKVVACGDFFAAEPPPLPFVLKAATEQSSGGGAAVFICRTRQDVAKAAELLSRCESLVVESFLHIAKNVCLHFAVLPDGAVRYLGYADQDVTEAGQHRGNWIHLGAVLAQSVIDVAQEVVSRGGALGYRGITGIDMAVTDDGRIMVIDLNFRVNGSSSSVLLAPAILQQRGPGVLHVRRFRGTGTFADMLAAARSAVRSGRLIPIACLDPLLAGYPSPPCMRALVLGSSIEEILAIETELAATGIV